jgi:hypothetical protein
MRAALPLLHTPDKQPLALPPVLERPAYFKQGEITQLCFCCWLREEYFLVILL